MNVTYCCNVRGDTMDIEKLKNQYTVSIMQGSTDRMAESADNLMDLFTDSVMNNTVQLLKNELIIEEGKMEALINLLGINDDIEKQKIYYFAVLKTIIDLNSELAEKLSNNLNDFHAYKYVYPILGMLQNNMTMTHGNIAYRLGLSSQALTGFITRTKKFNLWKIEERGKSNYYSLTINGKEAYKRYVKNDLIKSDEASIEKIMICLIDSISTEITKRTPDINQIINNLNETCGHGTSICSSSMFKYKLNNLFVNNNICFYNKFNYYRDHNKLPRNYFVEYNYHIDDSDEYTNVEVKFKDDHLLKTYKRFDMIDKSEERSDFHEIVGFNKDLLQFSRDNNRYLHNIKILINDKLEQDYVTNDKLIDDDLIGYHNKSGGFINERRN